ncbi:hypothetical protein [Neorhizobium sp. S3-V5DH]|uniref:hypothetical protein n=1 Tax=Neorhizobium sp. S3-V5DH TaxID=2485166 RepID=UPI001FE21EE7|nr:hypothetical protein [Neorhizobium sp. S3-V5DH]
MTALVNLLRELGTETIDMFDIGVPLVDRGFTQNEIVDAIMMLEHRRFVELIPGNRLRVLKLL